MQACTLRGQIAHSNDIAREAIYATLNGPIKNRWEVDLHGLHVHEALQKVYSTYEFLRQSSCECTTSLVVLTALGIYIVGMACSMRVGKNCLETTSCCENNCLDHAWLIASSL